MALDVREVREAVLDVLHGVLEILARPAGEALNGKLEHQEMTTPARSCEDWIDPLILGVPSDAAPGLLCQERPLHRRPVRGNRRIELHDELLAEEVAQACVERRERFTVEQPSTQSGATACGDDRARDDDQAMHRDRAPRQSRCVAGVDHGGCEPVGLDLNQLAKRLGACHRLQFAPHPPPRPVSSEDKQAILARSLANGRGSIAGPGPRRVRVPRQPAAISQAIGRDSKPPHDTPAECQDRAQQQREDLWAALQATGDRRTQSLQSDEKSVAGIERPSAPTVVRPRSRPQPGASPGARA